MKIIFYKYHGTGNDFIIIDNRNLLFNCSDVNLVAKLCDRHFGIGADGLMLLQQKAGFDFEMIYFNSNGKQGSMCGNGGRCIVEFAHTLGLVGGTAKFMAADGCHEAIIKPPRVSGGFSGQFIKCLLGAYQDKVFYHRDDLYGAHQHLHNVKMLEDTIFV